MKKHYIKLLASLLLVVMVLAACGGHPLQPRNKLEGDVYLRSNIQYMDWNSFSKMVSKQSSVTEHDFEELKELLSTKESTFFIQIKDRFYRFISYDKSLLYYVQWIKEDGKYYILDIKYIKTDEQDGRES